MVDSVIDVAALRSQFPILSREVHGRALAYLDNASTTQRPRRVLDAVDEYYTRYNANVHRGLYAISEEATAAYEGVREKVARLLGVDEAKRIVFTRGTTESINLVAHAYLQPRLRADDEILVTTMEHHSNIVPWQLVAERSGATVVEWPMDERGTLDVEGLESRLNSRTKLVAVTHVSNAIGTVNPIAEIARRVHDAGAKLLVDGAQAVPHLPIEVDALGADFYALSAHKMYGPTGVGVLCGRAELLEAMDPWQGGGDMIREVSFEGTTYADPPQRFEAGTPNIAGVIGLGEAIDFLLELGLDRVAAHEGALCERAFERLTAIDGVSIVGDAPQRAAVVSFNLGSEQASDVAMLLDQEGIAVRSGHHCAQPLMRHFGVRATVRASFAPYNTFDEVDRLAEALLKVKRVLAV